MAIVKYILAFFVKVIVPYLQCSSQFEHPRCDEVSRPHWARPSACGSRLQTKFTSNPSKKLRRFTTNAFYKRSSFLEEAVIKLVVKVDTWSMQRGFAGSGRRQRLRCRSRRRGLTAIALCPETIFSNNINWQAFQKAGPFFTIVNKYFHW